MSHKKMLALWNKSKGVVDPTFDAESTSAQNPKSVDWGGLLTQIFFLSSIITKSQIPLFFWGGGLLTHFPPTDFGFRQIWTSASKVGLTTSLPTHWPWIFGPLTPTHKLSIKSWVNSRPQPYILILGFFGRSGASIKSWVNNYPTHLPTHFGF